MAIVKNNPLTANLSGMLGRFVVFKQLRGKTILANSPRKPTSESELQRENRVNFRNAAAYASAAMRDPTKKEHFRKKAHEMKLPNAYTAALSAYLRAEKIKNANPMAPCIFPDRWRMIYERLKTHVMSAFRIFRREMRACRK